MVVGPDVLPFLQVLLPGGYIPVPTTYKLLRQIRDEGGEAAVFAGDVTKADVTEEMAAFTVKTYGRLDILHNNAIPRFRGIPGRRQVPKSRKMSNKSKRPTDCIVARDPMTLKDYPWCPVGSARPRPLLSGSLLDLLKCPVELKHLSANLGHTTIRNP
jgi:short chain dehydrogenase